MRGNCGGRLRKPKPSASLPKHCHGLGWTGADLKQRNKSAPEKLELAARLRRETTLTIKEIAQRLHVWQLQLFPTRFPLAAQWPFSVLGFSVSAFPGKVPPLDYTA